MKARYISILCAIILLTMGCIVMLGWFLHSPVMVQIFSGFIGMVFNTSLLFVASGFVMLLGNLINQSNKKNIFLMLGGMAIFAYAALSFSQDLFSYDLGMDRWIIYPWLSDPNPTPGRMAPNSCIGFMVIGITFFLFPYARPKKLSNLITLLIFLLMLISLVGTLVYSLQLEFIFSWHRFTRMAIHTALGFAIASIGLWTLLIQYYPYKRLFQDHEERKITFLAGIVLISLTIITGLGSIAIISYSSFNLIGEAFQNSLQNKISMFDFELHAVDEKIKTSLNNPEFKQVLIEAENHDSSDVQEKFKLLLSDEFNAFKIMNSERKVIYSNGEFIKTPGLIVSVKKNYPAYLEWNNGFWYKFDYPIYSQDHTLLGYVYGEVALPNILKSYYDYKTLGNSGDNILCKKENAQQAICFPSRFNKQTFTIPLTFNNEEQPISYALQGATGTKHSIDPSYHRIISAYGPVSDLGLGLLVQMDALEIYRPVQRLLLFIFPSALILIAIGLVLFNYLVKPLIQKIKKSEQEANDTKEELQQSQERYRISVDCSNIGLWDWEVNTSNFFYSPLFQTLLDFKNDDEKFLEIIHLLASRLHPDDRENVLNIFQSNLETYKQFNIDFRLINDNGEYAWFQMIGQSILDSQGNPTRMAGSLADISERKRVEALKNEFISTVSHELRTPLTSIRGAISLILDGKTGAVPDKMRTLLDIANQNSNRLIVLINDILDIDKIESGKLRLDLKPIPIKKVVEDAIAANQMFSEKFHIKVELTDRCSDCIVNVDYDRLMQVLTNLISNAIKFSPTGEKVKISILNVGDKVRVEVADHGPGIPDEFKKRIFQKFSQADSTSTRKVGGTGLGLSISKAITEAMNGTIGFIDNSKGTTIFYFELPLTT